MADYKEPKMAGNLVKASNAGGNPCPKISKIAGASTSPKE
jgi:hypothetical protein